MTPLTQVDEVLRRVLDGVPLLGVEYAPLTEAGGRILAEDITARLTQPPFDAAAMDGYAVRAGDIARCPVQLTVTGVAAAGRAFAGAAGQGEAVRIFTGAPLPAGADTVVIQENARQSGSIVQILQAVPLGANVRSRGHDFSEGDNLLKAGQRLDSRAIMLAAAMNYASLPVRVKPVIAILATGDELVPPGAAPRPGQIISSIPAGLKAAVESWGAEARLMGIARDTMESLSQAITAAQDCDVLVTLGGASEGEHDLVRQAFLAAGMSLDIWKIAMRPGKPLIAGRLGYQRVLGMPGNPVSAFICARVFLKPLIDAMRGHDASWQAVELPLLHAMKENGPRRHYMRGTMSASGVSVFPDQDSSLTTALADANCLVIREIGAPALQQGDCVPVLPLDF